MPPFRSTLVILIIIVDDQLAVFVSRLGALYKATLRILPPRNPPHPFRVLDLDYGTGIWTRSFARAHPSCTITGIDVLPPSERQISNLRDFPRNCAFVKGDFEQEWAFEGSEEPFDFIYARMLMAGVHDWPALLRRCYNRLRPGGYFEIFEGLMEMKAEDDGAGPEISPAIRWFRIAAHYLATVGLKWDVALDLPGYLRDTGFAIDQDVQFKMHLSSSLPDGPFGEQRKAWGANQYLRDMCDMVENMSPYIFRHGCLGMSLEEGTTLASEAIQDMKIMGRKRGLHTTL